MQNLNHRNIVDYIADFKHFDRRTGFNHSVICMKHLNMDGERFMMGLKEKARDSIILSKFSGMSSSEKINETIFFLLSAALGLNYLHDSGILHMDLKPSNVLVEWNEDHKLIEKVQIIDFGGSKEKDVHFQSTHVQITKVYCAPEVKLWISTLKRYTTTKTFEPTCSKNMTDKFFFEKAAAADKKEGEVEELMLLPFGRKADIYSFGKMMLDFKTFIWEKKLGSPGSGSGCLIHVPKTCDRNVSPMCCAYVMSRWMLTKSCCLLRILPSVMLGKQFTSPFAIEGKQKKKEGDDEEENDSSEMDSNDEEEEEEEEVEGESDSDGK